MVSARGPRKFGPLPVCPCGEATSSKVFSQPLPERTYREQNLEYQAGNRKIYDKLSGVFGGREEGTEFANTYPVAEFLLLV